MIIQHFICLWIAFGQKLYQVSLFYNEAKAAKWLTKEELYSLDWLPADVCVVDEINEQIEGINFK